MKEIEVKILEINKEDIITKLESIGAQKLEKILIEDYFYDYPDNPIAAKNEELRLRVINKKKATLTYKKNREVKNDLKQMDEYETEISDYKTMNIILNALGLTAAANYAKERITYKLNNTRFEIDTYAGIPTYLEIEAPTETEVITAVELLGYKMENTTALIAPEIFDMYKDKLKKPKNDERGF